MTKEKVLMALKRCATKLGRTPTATEIRRMTGISAYFIHRHFNNLAHALQQAGIEPRGVGHRVDTVTLMADWAQLTRKLGRPPSHMEYKKAGQFGANSILNRCGAWSRAGERFRALVMENKMESEWADVLEIIAKWEGKTTAEGRRTVQNGRKSERTINDEPQPRRKILPGRPIYGAPSKLAGMSYEPVNEAGVVYVFGRVADKLGMEVERIQTAFPDCEAMREVAQGKWQRVKIEFEFASRNFVDHGHAQDGCDIIVCWVHNWVDCPEHLEVIELRRLVRQIG
jgi:Homing endonuclease associated repeat